MRGNRRMIVLFAAGIAGLASWNCLADDQADPPNGNGSIRADVAGKPLVISTTNRVAGAIDSLRWNGKEFIDSHDHGRQLQSACSFDIAPTRAYCAECFNPTEAGSRADGTGEKSSSILLAYKAEGAELRTTTQMAFWLAPNEKTFGLRAQNTKVLSEHRLTKRVHIGYKSLPHVIEYEVIFNVPAGEEHTYAQFEALTGYMPPEFANFWSFVPATGKLERLSDGPGEQEYPVVFSTDNGAHALGIFSPETTPTGEPRAEYGRFRFELEKVVKWNCVFRERNSREGIRVGPRHFRMFVVVGSLDDVRTSLVALAAEYFPK